MTKVWLVESMGAAMVMLKALASAREMVEVFIFDSQTTEIASSGESRGVPRVVIVLGVTALIPSPPSHCYNTPSLLEITRQVCIPSEH